MLLSLNYPVNYLTYCKVNILLLGGGQGQGKKEKGWAGNFLITKCQEIFYI